MVIITYNEQTLLNEKLKYFISGVLNEFHQPNVIRDDLNNLNIYTQDNNVLYVLIDDENVVGTIGVINSAGKIFIKRFYLAKEIRGRGFGRKLFDLAISHIKKQNLKCVYLNCDSANMKDAYHFYLRNGFKVIDKRSDGYVYMRKGF